MKKNGMSLHFLYFVTKYVVYTSVKYLSRSPNSSKVTLDILALNILAEMLTEDAQSRRVNFKYPWVSIEAKYPVLPDHEKIN